MALSSRSRAELYQSLSRAADPEAVEEMLSNFPVRELDEPATKAFIEMRIGELEREVSLVQPNLTAQLAQLETRLTALVGSEVRSSTRWMIGMMFIMTMAIIGAQAWFG